MTPEFVDAHGLKVLFCLSRTHAYPLTKEGYFVAYSGSRDGLRFG